MCTNFAAYSVMNERPKVLKNREFTKFKIMSETTKMTAVEILEEFKHEYQRLVKRYEREVEKYTLKMNEDYEYFFRWYADDRYKAVLNLEALRAMREISYWDDLEKVVKCLENHINNIERNLLEGTITPTSTNIMMNVADMLKKVAMQELRVDLNNLLLVAQNKG